MTGPLAGPLAGADTSTPAVVLKLDPNVMHHGGLGVIRSLGRIPTDDAGAIFLAEHGDSLRESFLVPEPPRDLPRQVAVKCSLHELCTSAGVPSVAAAVPDPLPAARDSRRLRRGRPGRGGTRTQPCPVEVSQPTAPRASKEGASA